ncbi:MAG: hypothetical protein FD146_578 [Anaerolineaceae bacterium]|nr:MAG: hypothetical protein FD146_578 [Anaerolineaceae bacterium]
MTTVSLQTEEKVVAELAQLGVRYLSRQSNIGTVKRRAPQELLAALVRQPSSRVRVALIALLLARPDYARYVPAALKRLTPPEMQTLKFFYTAAICLQKQYAETLQVFLGAQWQPLPDLFSEELGLSGEPPAARMEALARLHARQTGEGLNWAGTYENAARHLLRRWEMEKLWDQ